MGLNKFITKKGRVLLDLTEDTVTPETLGKGATAHDRSGEPIVGTMEGGGSPIPIEVETEIEMNTLLLLEETEVGAVYKYTGDTTARYESGALYVVEEAEIATYSLSVVMSGVDSGFKRYYEPDKTPTDYNDMVANSHRDGSAPYTIDGIKSFVYVMYPFDFNASKSSFVNCDYELYTELSSLKITVTGENASCNIWADD